MAAIPPQLLANQLDLLHSILPPDTIIHTGAGHGAGCAQQWLKWQPPHAVIIDADVSRLHWAEQQLPSHPGWGCGEAVLGGEEVEADYHLASNRNEDGLLAPESLTPLWPNLRTIETVKKPVRRLDTLLRTEYQEVLNDSRCIWAIIESLPALPILQGAGQELDRWSVVWVRVLLSPAPQPDLHDATLAAVEAYLAQHGFNCALVIEGNHPAVGEAIFVRDWRHVLATQLTEQQAQLDQVVQGKDEQAKIAAERQTQLEQRTKERDEATKDLAERQAQLDQAVKTRDEQTKLANDRHSMIQKLTQERDEAAKVLSERQAEIQRLSKLSAEKKFGSDANIDDFIDDLTPFFSSRSITYVDVGSFIGEVFLKLYHSKKINIREAHLYEPNPDSYEKLKDNISPCTIASMHAYNIAISKQTGDMLFSAAKSMSKSLDLSLDTNLVTNTFKANCIPLDDMTSSFTDHHIDLLKVDVEGKEIDVLTSASNLLKEQRIDVIYIEAGLNKDGTQQTYLINIDIFLQNYGYRVFKIYEQTNEWIQDSPLLRRCNVAYMSSRFAQANPYKLTRENHKLRQELAKVKSHS